MWAQTQKGEKKTQAFCDFYFQLAAKPCTPIDDQDQLRCEWGCAANKTLCSGSIYDFYKKQEHK